MRIFSFHIFDLSQRKWSWLNSVRHIDSWQVTAMYIRFNGAAEDRFLHSFLHFTIVWFNLNSWATRCIFIRIVLFVVQSVTLTLAESGLTTCFILQYELDTQAVLAHVLLAHVLLPLSNQCVWVCVTSALRSCWHLTRLRNVAGTPFSQRMQVSEHQLFNRCDHCEIDQLVFVRYCERYCINLREVQQKMVEKIQIKW